MKGRRVYVKLSFKITIITHKVWSGILVIKYAIAFLASGLCFLLGTSAAETVNSAANIFLGLSEAPILIKPFMKHMTDSELFVVMAGGFASIAGSVFGAIIEFKIQKEHLLTACLMGAPGALALSKLSFPEILKSKITIKSIREYKTEEKYINCLDAILSGARIALSICAAIMAALIAMISILSFADSICVWIFSMFGRKHIDFQYLLSYFFYPMVWMLGISHYDSLTAGRLFGLKTFVNEFKAFSDLGNIISTRDLILNNGTNSSCQLHNSSFILLDDKSVVVMTYALCGFSNISSIAIVLGSLSVLAPTKTHVFNKYVVKALLIAIATNLITACFASCLYVPTTDSTLLDICPGFRN
ncbi:hypothetical protein GJ496_010619 [Pomphorhynchus laevis]|nr:hypothetical protein GJ496_010619 [Pomphorhynchus laevis]